MPDPVDEIVQRLFARANADATSAPLAGAFAEAFAEGRWTTETLDLRVGSFIANEARRADVDEHERVG
jgi:hypothetical protein